MWSSIDTYSVFQVPQAIGHLKSRIFQQNCKQKEERHYNPPYCDAVTWKQARYTILNASQTSQTPILPLYGRALNILTTSDHSVKFHDIFERFGHRYLWRGYSECWLSWCRSCSNSKWRSSLAFKAGTNDHFGKELFLRAGQRNSKSFCLPRGSMYKCYSRICIPTKLG